MERDVSACRDQNEKKKTNFFFSFLFYSFFFLLSFFIIRESSANKKSERARYGLYGGQIPMDRFCPRIIIIIISRSKPPWWNMVGDTAYNNNEIIRNKRAWHDRKKKKRSPQILIKKIRPVSPAWSRNESFVLPETNLIVQRQIDPEVGRLKIK